MFSYSPELLKIMWLEISVLKQLSPYQYGNSVTPWPVHFLFIHSSFKSTRQCSKYSNYYEHNIKLLCSDGFSSSVLGPTTFLFFPHFSSFKTFCFCLCLRLSNLYKSFGWTDQYCCCCEYFHALGMPLPGDDVRPCFRTTAAHSLVFYLGFANLWFIRPFGICITYIYTHSVTAKQSNC